MSNVHLLYEDYVLVGVYSSEEALDKARMERAKDASKDADNSYHQEEWEVEE